MTHQRVPLPGSDPEAEGSEPQLGPKSLLVPHCRVRHSGDVTYELSTTHTTSLTVHFRTCVTLVGLRRPLGQAGSSG